MGIENTGYGNKPIRESSDIKDRKQFIFIKWTWFGIITLHISLYTRIQKILYTIKK